MTINEIKGLTKYLSEEDVEKIKEEIKSKEDILKEGSLEEEELIQVLNTLFAILVIEKTLETDLEDVEEIRDELETELLESYQIYDSYMSEYQRDKKKKKKGWLSKFLFLSEGIHAKKEALGGANSTIGKLKDEINELKQQKSKSNLKNVVDGKHRHAFESFCDCPKKHNHPHEHDGLISSIAQISRQIDNQNVQRIANKITEKVDRTDTNNVMINSDVKIDSRQQSKSNLIGNGRNH